MMRMPLLIATWVGTAALAWSGCSRQSADTSPLEKTFPSNAKPDKSGLPGADSATQKMVSDAVQAIKNNDPAEGVVILQGVRTQPNLSPEQLTAVQDMIAQAQKPIIDRADRGDPAALAALQRIRESKRRQ